MLEEIAQAKRSIRIESYIFAGDEVGWRFAKVLAEKARSGVRVQVQVDAAGAFFENTESLFRYMQENAVATQWFNRWCWRDVHVRVDNCLGGQAASMFDDSWAGIKRHAAPPWQGSFRVVPNSTGSCRRVLHCMGHGGLSQYRLPQFFYQPGTQPDQSGTLALSTIEKHLS